MLPFERGQSPPIAVCSDSPSFRPPPPGPTSRALLGLLRKELQLRRHGPRSVCAEILAVPAVLDMMIGFWLAFKMGAGADGSMAADYGALPAGAMDATVVSSRDVLFAPASSAPAQRAALAVAAGSPRTAARALGFATEAALLRHYAQGTNAERVCPGIVLRGDAGLVVRYFAAFRFAVDSCPPTGLAVEGRLRAETEAAAAEYCTRWRRACGRWRPRAATARRRCHWSCAASPRRRPRRAGARRR